MKERPAASITGYFGSLEDPRSDHTRRHKLIDIITIAICGVICGADSWVDLEIFGKSKQEWLKGFLELPGGIPSHDTFGRVFSLLDAQQFRDCFSAWVQAVNAVTRGQVIAIDGKTVRRSHDRSLGKSAIHMVSAWASENRLVLGQTKVSMDHRLECGSQTDQKCRRVSLSHSHSAKKAPRKLTCLCLTSLVWRNATLNPSLT